MRSIPTPDRLRDPRLIAGAGLAACALAAAAALRPWAGSDPPVAISAAVEEAPAPAPQPAPPPVAPSLEGLRLHGVTPSGAILGFAGGVQRLVPIGRDVTPGLRLSEVRHDRVVLASAAGPLELGFQGPVPAAPAEAPAAAPPAAATEARREENLRYRFGLEPQRSDGRITGFAIRRGAELPILRRAGLQPGDVLVSVNGQSFDSQERVEELAAEIAGSFSAEFEFERGGRRMRTSLRVNDRN